MYEIKICYGPECGRPAHTKGLCASHMAQIKRGRPLTPIRRQKTDDEILRDTVSKAASKRATKNPVTICYGPECDRVARATGLCAAHYQQRYNGNELTPIKTQANRQDKNNKIRRCNVCRRHKPREEFHTRANGNPQSECKFCASKRSRINALKKQGRMEDAQALQSVWEAYVEAGEFQESRVAETIKWAALGHDYEVES